MRLANGITARIFVALLDTRVAVVVTRSVVASRRAIIVEETFYK